MAKLIAWGLAVLLGASAISACASTPPTPTPEPTLAPTVTPAPTLPPTATPEPSRTPAPTPIPDTESVIHYATAHNYMARGDYAEAERRFTIVVEMEPEFARGWDGRGQARMLKGDFEEEYSWSANGFRNMDAADTTGYIFAVGTSVSIYHHVEVDLSFSYMRAESDARYYLRGDSSDRSTWTWPADSTIAQIGLRYAF